MNESNDSTSLLGALSGHARSAPDRVAFTLAAEEERDERSLTYRQLRRVVHELGHALDSAGLGAGSHLAICMENRSAWPVAFLAAWYAGAVVVPLDAQQDVGTLGRMLEHGDVVACFTSSSCREAVTEAAGEADGEILVIDVDAGDRDWDGEPRSDTGSRGVSARQGDAKRSSDPGREVEGHPEGAGRAAGSGNPSGSSSGTSLGLETEGITTPETLCASHPLPDDAAWSPSEPAEGWGTIMYTSGTTGAPKGVVIERRAIVLNIEAALRRLDVAGEDHVLSVLPLFHVLPLLANCLGPVYVGARVTFLSELTPEKILAAFRRYAVTVFVCVPLFFYRFHDRVTDRMESLSPLRRRLAHGMKALCRFVRRRLGWNLGRRLFAAVHRPFGSELRMLLTGGAKMNADVYEDFLDWGFVLAQAYGLTEATAALTLTPPGELRGDTVGRPLDNVELRIESPDDDGVGEILARSPSLMVGYYKDREATSATIEDGWLCTGDLGRVLPDGHLQVTGRAKDVIVLASGKNIYPDELEDHFRQSDLVAEICIVGISDPGQRDAERLVAVVVPDLEAAERSNYANVREMVKWKMDGLAAQLPASRRPTGIEFRKEPLPRTTTRKVKRYEVRRQVEEERARREETGEELQAGRDRREDLDLSGLSALQADVVGTVARRSGRDAVGLEEHLDLDLGLESLDRVELAAELEERFGVTLPEEIAGRLQTVADVVEAVDERVGEGDAGGTDVAEAGRWQRVLQDVPEGIDPYLRRRRIVELLMWVTIWKARVATRLTCGYRVVGEDRLPSRYPFLLCPNHVSFVDSPMLGAALPLRVLRRLFFVGYSEYFEGRGRRLVARLLRVVPIDQNLNVERAMQAAAEGLRKELVLAIFPEGGRSADGEVQEFRRGAAILARHLQVPLVPVGLWGSYQMWPRGGFRGRHPLAVAFGEPLRPEGVDAGPEADRRLTERLRQAVSDSVDEARELWDEETE